MSYVAQKCSKRLLSIIESGFESKHISKRKNFHNHITAPNETMHSLDVSRVVCAANCHMLFYNNYYLLFPSFQ